MYKAQEMIGLTAVRARQQPRLEGANALRERTFEVERADHAVLGGAQRQFDHRHRHAMAARAAPR